MKSESSHFCDDKETKLLTSPNKYVQPSDFLFCVSCATFDQVKDKVILTYIFILKIAECVNEEK
jgi:hypothetical protein